MAAAATTDSLAPVVFLPLPKAAKGKKLLAGAQICIEKKAVDFCRFEKMAESLPFFLPLIPFFFISLLLHLFL